MLHCIGTQANEYPLFLVGNGVEHRHSRLLLKVSDVTLRNHILEVSVYPQYDNPCRCSLQSEMNVLSMKRPLSA